MTYTRIACAQVLGELRVEAVARAHARATRLVSVAHKQLGNLYRLKEDRAECPVDPSKPLSVHLRPALDGSKNPPTLQLPATVGPARVPLVLARVGALLVYELVQGSDAPAGEGPGEVHLGLLRTREAETQAVRASFELRVGVAHSDPTIASQQSAATMSGLLVRLRAAGLQEAELASAGVQVGTRTTAVDRRSDAYKVRDYIAQTRIEIATARIAQLGPWIALVRSTGLLASRGRAMRWVRARHWSMRHCSRHSRALCAMSPHLRRPAARSCEA